MVFKQLPNFFYFPLKVAMTRRKKRKRSVRGTEGPLNPLPIDTASGRATGGMGSTEAMDLKIRLLMT